MRTGQQRGFLVFSVVGLAVGATHALGQVINIEIADVTLTPGESTTITLSAGYADGDYAIAGIATEVVVNVLQGGLSDPALVAPMDGPGTSAGIIAGDGGITSIIAGQLNFPPVPIYADDTNPIAFHTFEFTLTDLPMSGLILDIETRTSRFDVYVDRASSRSESRLDNLQEGRAVIIPAPAGALVLGLGALAVGQRRRTHVGCTMNGLH